MFRSVQRRFERESRKLRRKLAKLGVHPAERAGAETPEDEYERLRKILRSQIDFLTRIRFA
jgi:hypothetical protein